jgi:hypothetical protein
MRQEEAGQRNFRWPSWLTPTMTSSPVYYQRFNQEVVSNLPEVDCTLTKQDLDKCREVSIDNKA